MKKMKKYEEGGVVDEEMPAFIGNRLNVGKDRGTSLGRMSKEDADLLKSTLGKDYATPRSKQANLKDAVESLGKRLKDNVMGTEKQNKEAAESLKRAGYFKKGGSVSSASKRADGCAVKGKTKGRMV